MSRPKRSARRTMHVLSVLLLASASGCYSPVRLVRQTPTGGVVVLPNNSNQWPTYYRNRAEFLMHRACPGGYVIEHEEAFEDNPAERDGRKPNEDFEYNGAYQRISTYARKSYRIAFRAAAADGGKPPLVKPKKNAPAVEESPVEEAPPPRRLPAKE